MSESRPPRKSSKTWKGHEMLVTLVVLQSLSLVMQLAIFGSTNRLGNALEYRIGRIR